MRPPENKETDQVSVRIKEARTLEDLSWIYVNFGEFSTMPIKGGGTEIICYRNVGDTRKKVVKALRERGYTVVEEREERGGL